MIQNEKYLISYRSWEIASFMAAWFAVVIDSQRQSCEHVIMSAYQDDVLNITSYRLTTFVLTSRGRTSIEGHP